MEITKPRKLSIERAHLPNAVIESRGVDCDSLCRLVYNVIQCIPTFEQVMYGTKKVRRLPNDLDLSEDRDTFWMTKDRVNFLSRRRISLLEKINEL